MLDIYETYNEHADKIVRNQRKIKLENLKKERKEINQQLTEIYGKIQNVEQERIAILLSFKEIHDSNGMMVEQYNIYVRRIQSLIAKIKKIEEELKKSKYVPFSLYKLIFM